MWPFSRSRSTNGNVNFQSENERTPLVPASRNIILEHQSQKRTPLPVKQLMVLCVMRITEPISYTLIFPFINQMLDDMKVSPDPKQIGYYAGVIESLYAVAQLCTAISWGRLSDHVGRKPVMLIGLTGMAISVILFGLQKTYLGLIASRFIAGMMNGNVGVLQSILVELTDETNHGSAVSLLPVCYAVGSIIGPIFGGFLAKPAQQFPSIFGNSTFLIEYPYFLPCFMGGLLNFLAIALGLFFLEETLPSKRKTKSYETRSDVSQTDQQISVPNPDQVRARPPSILSLCTGPILTLLLSFMLVHLQNLAWSAVTPLYAYTKVIHGGLGLSLEQIGLMLSVNGIGLIFVQLFFFPLLERRFGAVKVYRWSILAFTISFLCLPFVSYLVRLEDNTTSRSIGYMTTVMVLRCPGLLSYVCSMMLIKIFSPNSQALGTLNGMMQACRALAQAVGPILGSSLFAISISTGILGGNLVWIILALVCVIAQLGSFLLPDQASVENVVR
ncbi:uncharacterized protein MELLADRAFT_94763 [Melampsora larici-populina 98AG31]|uniref:Major facilitator superfamily (MFS) profile domain-containing protein n=1 Tax=Melampsora larici-populina (strain 98AG31 / pathotype 3-4-7) TaxID=747676 RepID=F4S7U4_MELLP|nr:uncharacterized protein MELLADRAFT_94763 [Melampsora larici-populina 98AG31]EGF99271.1 hypothetical protein MELLADRAFT_94763 [Melampsora larici-populina 98AG31]